MMEADVLKFAYDRDEKAGWVDTDVPGVPCRKSDRSMNDMNTKIQIF